MMEMIPYAPGLVRITVGGDPGACEEWVNLLDWIAGWRPATTWAVSRDDEMGTQEITAYLVRGAYLVPDDLKKPPQTGCQGPSTLVQ